MSLMALCSGMWPELLLLPQDVRESFCFLAGKDFPTAPQELVQSRGAELVRVGREGLEEALGTIPERGVGALKG